MGKNKIKLISAILIIVNIILILPLPNDKFPISSGGFWASLLGLLAGWSTAIFILQKIAKKFLDVNNENKEFIALNIAILIYVTVFLAVKLF